MSRHLVDSLCVHLCCTDGIISVFNQPFSSLPFSGTKTPCHTTYLRFHLVIVTVVCHLHRFGCSSVSFSLLLSVCSLLLLMDSAHVSAPSASPSSPGYANSLSKNTPALLDPRVPPSVPTTLPRRYSQHFSLCGELRCHGLGLLDSLQALAYQEARHLAQCLRAQTLVSLEVD